MTDKKTNTDDILNEILGGEDKRRERCLVRYGNRDPESKEVGTVIWSGRQWAVTEDGIECLDGKYFIDKDRLTENLGVQDYGGWCSHMGMKTWVDTDDFITAWLIGLTLHGYQIDPQQVRHAILETQPQEWNQKERAADAAYAAQRRTAISEREDEDDG